MLNHNLIKNPRPAGVTLSTVICLLLLSAALCGCEKNPDQNIFTIVTMNVSCPSVSAGIERVEVDNSLDGSFIRDLNTRQEYEIPVFQVGTATVRLRKGIYMISFDGKAVFSDGQRKKVRFAGHNSPMTSVTLLNDKETLNLELTVIR